MIQTAISVARNCGMVAPQDKVVMVQCHAPDKENPTARVEWTLAEAAEDPELVDEDSDSTPTAIAEVRTVIEIICIL
jgi:hypothetical protein